MASPSEIGTWIGGAAVAAWGVWQTKRADKHAKEATQAKELIAVAQKRLDTVSSDDLAKKNHEIAEAYKIKSEEWKSTWEKEHSESQAYRKLVHERNDQANAEHLKLIEENALLRARTDLTPIIEHVEKQSSTNERVAGALTQLTTVIQSLIVHLPPRES